MRFEVEQADHYKPFEDYGLPTMARTYNDEILTDADEIAESEEISFRFSEIEITSLADLLKFKDKCKCPVIIDEVDNFFPAIAKRYKYQIKLYNDYLE